MSGVRIPAEMHAEFERFRRDFDAVWVQWVADGVETEATRKHARAELAEWFARIQGEPDQAERLRAVFAYWRELAARLDRVGGAVSVRPVPSNVEMHSRWIDRDHARAQRTQEQTTDRPQEPTPC